MKTFINIIAFYAVWFGCIVGAARGGAELGLAAAAIGVVIHLTVIRRGAREAGLLVACGGLGTVFDSAMMRMGAISFPGAAAEAWLCPAWMTALWVAFATLLNVSLTWLRGRPLVAAVLGAIGGQASYYAGQRLGAIQLGQPWMRGIGLVALEWAVAMPLLVWLAARSAADTVKAKAAGTTTTRAE